MFLAAKVAHGQRGIQQRGDCEPIAAGVACWKIHSNNARSVHNCDTYLRLPAAAAALTPAAVSASTDTVKVELPVFGVKVDDTTDAWPGVKPKYTASALATACKAWGRVRLALLC
jgi:hypothetical protein